MPSTGGGVGPSEVRLDPRVGPVLVALRDVSPARPADQVGEQARRVPLADRQGMLGRREESEPVGLTGADEFAVDGLAVQVE